MQIQSKYPAFIQRRIRAGFSQRRLAHESGLSSPFISQVENGNRNIGPEAAKAICEVLKCGFDEIFELKQKAEGDILVTTA
ncbi:helix-turn-helix domain-containing protein [Tumebacillus flagellatus]|uniref:HTH cro/C1-type domain-containing protein n=1 Tax=Tumebacillus flagellatus TaxID=1157490 RepID=A0A074LVB7_9BACL|nr:hypothetical protein EL26_02580 [Tumebacillus flagellatus]